MSTKKFIGRGLIVAILCLLVMHVNEVIGFGAKLFAVAYPLLLGCVFAYVLNILMVRLERIYAPKSNNMLIVKTRRPVCMILSVALLVFIVFFVLYLVIPQVVNCFVIISKGVPEAIDELIAFLISKSDEIPTFQKELKNLNLDWGNIFNKVSTGLMKGTKGLWESATTFLGSFVGTVTNIVVGIIFSLYVLACKEEVGEKISRVMKAFLNRTVYEKISYVLKVVDQCFSSFIVGQVTEAIILGSLCAIGMYVLRLPYAGSIGALVGLTALIPVFGAYIGAVLGAFMIVTVEPKQALVFLVYLLILQQIEGNFIYPKVVGSSIGLPGIWVLAAIMVGSGLGGVVGMLVGVPIAASLYKLVRNATSKREQQREYLPNNVKPM
ncbi:MAG: AI-2E family transporter [Eubacteriales bacterium]|nr:AI-2E family transporter [Eubacteriales bacterium]